LVDELDSSVAEGVCNDTSSVPRILTQSSSEHQALQLAASFGETEDQSRTVRQVWSREEFLHETAGMGGPDVSMRPRSVESSLTQIVSIFVMLVQFCLSRFFFSSKQIVVGCNYESQGLCGSTYLHFMLL
jgi:hypothetical protein